MAQKLTAAMPQDFDLGANFVVRLAAVDPASGANVSGVTVSNVALMAKAVVAAAAQEPDPDFVPLFLPVPSELPEVTP